MNTDAIQRMAAEAAAEIAKIDAEIAALQRRRALVEQLRQKAEEVVIALGAPQAPDTLEPNVADAVGMTDTAAANLTATATLTAVVAVDPEPAEPGETLWFAAKRVLRAAGRPLTVGQLVEALKARGFTFTVNGKEVVRAAIWRKMKDGKNPIFQSSGPGLYGLAEWGKEKTTSENGSSRQAGHHR